MASKLPYVSSPGNVTKVLDKIIHASTPQRFTQDFLATKLGMSGGSAKPLIPFLKQIGFLGSDGTPTELYVKFRNPKERGAAIARAILQGYRGLYEVNEYAHDLSDDELKGAIVQATGAETKSRAVEFIVSCFKALKQYADFEQLAKESETKVEPPSAPPPGPPMVPPHVRPENVGFNLSYTINLNLPTTTDTAVFDAIFTSLRKHLLRE
jgi:hypothetical protein